MEVMLEKFNSSEEKFFNKLLAANNSEDLPHADQIVRNFGFIKEMTSKTPRDRDLLNSLTNQELTTLEFAVATIELWLRKNLADRDMIVHIHELIRYASFKFAQEPKQLFLGVMLDSRNRIISCKVFQTGSKYHVHYYPREVAKTVLQYDAKGIILIRTVSGNELKPLDQELENSQKLELALRTFDVALCDHLLISKNDHLSLMHSFYWKGCT